MQQKKNAIDWHRTVQAGLQAKTDLVEALKQRERASHCGSSSDLLACEYFKSEYVLDDEVEHEGYPLDLLDQKKVLQFEYNTKEREYMSKLGAVERVRWSLCPTKTLLPDDDARIFTKVGEYLNFMGTEGAQIKATSHKTVLEKRKHTLFGAFLEDGERGYEQGVVFLSEWLGLLLSPLIVSTHYALLAYQHTVQYLWTEVQYYSSLDPTESSAAYIPLPFIQLCQYMTTVEVEGSPLYNAANALDYTSYSGIMAFLDTASETFRTPLWVWEIANRSPCMYYEYYFAGGRMKLPPARKACMLRNGLDVAQTEIDAITEKIKAEDDLRALLLKASSPPSAVKAKKGRKGLAARSTPPVIVDYGADSVFEVLKDVCVEKTFGAYEYSLCFFKEIKQSGHTSLGVFTNWGPPGVVKSTTRPPPKGRKADPSSSIASDLGEVFEAFGDVVSDVWTQVSEWFTGSAEHVFSSVQPVLGEIFTPDAAQWLHNQTCSITECDTTGGVYNSATNLMSSGKQYESMLKRHRHSNGTVMLDAIERHYSQQFYSEGTVCQTKQGFARRAEVQLECDVRNDLKEVVELEMCSYRLIVGTPVVCTRHMEERSVAELDRLGVFGFSSAKSRKT
eukprot:gene23625-29864_t